MGISSALYTGVSGLNTNGQAMTVIGNNLANTNTIAYKGSRTVFSDLLSSSISGSGGISQVGRGVGLSRVDNQFSQGTFESTESGLDLAIEGESFFILSPEGEDTNYYSRAGAFSFSQDGYMVNPEGLRVQGILYDENGELIGGNPSDIFVDSAGLIQGRATDEVVLTTNLDSNAPILEDGGFDVTNAATYNFVESETGIVDNNGDTIDVNIYYRKINSNEWEVYYDATRTSVDPLDNGSTIAVVQTTNMMLDSNGNPVESPGGGVFDPIPNGTTFNWTSGATLTSTSTAAATVDTAVVSQQANANTQTFEFDYTDPTTYTYSASVQIFDSLGNPHLLSHYFRKTSNNTWDVYYSAETDDGTIIPADPNALPMTTLSFGSEGQPIDPATGIDLPTSPTASTVALDWGNGSEPTAAIIEFDTTQFNSESIVISQDQNGFGAGNYAGVSVDEDGRVIASYSNGETRAVASLSLARFTNPLGLSMEGSNLFAETTSSGAARIGIPGPELGAIFTNSLEQSNVDMGAEFVKMITTQRGYQANSKIITTVDGMLEELINLKR